MQVLITSSRMPYAVSELRAFSECGHIVHAADTYSDAPGSASNRVTYAHETITPLDQPEAYARQIQSIVDQYAIDLVVPMFEEVLYLRSVEPQPDIPLFASSFETLSLLHDKSRFLNFAGQRGHRVPQTSVCTSRADFERATRAYGQFFARAAYSRAGTGVATNVGELKDLTDLASVRPSPESPWVVQPYQSGEEICAFSVAYHGQVVAHTTYEHPKTLDGIGGIEFCTINDAEVLATVRDIVSALQYHGQISFDFMRTDKGELHLVECNPRPTAGACLMDDQLLVDAVLGKLAGQPTVVTPPGRRSMIRAALLRDTLLNPDRFVDNARAIVSDVPDVYFDKDDLNPGLCQFKSVGHIAKNLKDEAQQPRALAAGFLKDVSWNG